MSSWRAPRPRPHVSRWAVCALFACALAAAGTATATETRVRSLGGDGDWFDDTANVLRWYGCLPAYPQMAVVEYGEYAWRAEDSAGAGVHWSPAGRDGTASLGLYLFDDLDRANNPARPDGVNVLAGWRWGRAALGLHVGTSYVWAGAEMNELSLGLGARLDLNPRAFLDLAADLRGSRLRREEGEDAVERQSWGSFALRARALRELGPQVVLLAVAEYARDDRDLLVPAFLTYGGLASSRLDAWAARGGVAVQVLPHPDAMVIAAIDWREGRQDVAQWPSGGQLLEPIPVISQTHSYPTERLAVEARVRPWLSLRASCVHVPTGVAQPLWVPGVGSFDVACGLGFHVGDLDADVLLSDGAPFNLGSWLTNAGEQERSTFTGVSLAYAF